MKKQITIIFLLLLPVLLFADDPSPSSIRIRVTGSGNDELSYDIGFSVSEVTEWSVQPVRPETNKIPLATAFNKDGNAIGKLAEKSLYLYWRNITNRPVQLSFALSGPLEYNGSFVDWTVSWPKIKGSTEMDSISSATTAPNVYKIVRVTTDFNNKESDGDSVPLSIETASLEGAVATGTYTGTLKLEIKLL